MLIIRSKKFILRPFQKGDELSLRENINDITLSRNTLRIPYPYTMKDAQQWVKRKLEMAKKKEKHELILAIVINKQVIGCVGLDKIEDGCAELGYWLGKNYRGQGIMTEATNLIVKYAFNKMKLRRIYAFVFTWNKPSAGVLKNIGFAYEGLLKKHAKKGNKILDSLLFAKVK